MDPRHNPTQRITRFVRPGGLTTLFAADVTPEEANILGVAMEELHLDLLIHAALTNTLPSVQRIARSN